MQYKPKDNQFTLVFTNSVPQFGSVNSGGWNQHEQRMLRWADKNFQGAPIHIIVGSYHQRMGETILDLFVKQDSVIMIGHRGVRQRIGPTGLTWWPLPIQLHVVKPHHSLKTLRFILETDPVINWQSLLS